MVESNESFLNRLMATFRVEADEHLLAMAAQLRELEGLPSPHIQVELIETLFREVHSLKGAARAVDLHDLEAGCQVLEGQLASVKSGEWTLSSAMLDDFYQQVDRLNKALAELSPTSATQPARVAVAANVAVGDTVRITTGKLNDLLNQAEGLLALKFHAAHRVSELGALSKEFADWKRDWGKTVSEARALRRNWKRSASTTKRTARLDDLLDAIEGDALRVKLLHEQLLRLTRAAAQERRTTSSMVDSLLDDMKQALMLPMASQFELLPKLVRDLARDNGKDVELSIRGTAIEVDRRILEQLKDPLIHLLRNAIDHGIESAAERRLAGKPSKGTISITASALEGNKIELTVRDDGGGIQIDRVQRAAEKMGLLGLSPTPQDTHLYSLLFESGLSTSPILTNISGRGLGLAIVREKVDRLGGTISVESAPQRGTTFHIVLPTTLSTFRGLLITLGERQFILPSAQVERACRIPKTAVKTVENRATIEINGEALSLAWLADALSLLRTPESGVQPAYSVVILNANGRRVAFVVDTILDDREVLVKPLGPQLRRVRNVVAATILGAGAVVPILNPADLVKSAIKRAAAALPAVLQPRPALRKSLLVVEDSITSRSLLKNILETAGYEASTAVDGIDALTSLRTGRFDLVVSDVEMPRMDGFDLTTRIRQEPKLKDLPVVLVTALDSREDRERGVDVGADAYIVKSGFDQSNLLEVIKRLL